MNIVSENTFRGTPKPDAGIPILIPISYLNAYVYCPRRFYLEHVRGMFEDNVHTIEGRSRHRVVDMRGRQARPTKKEDVIHRRSVSFSSDKLGIIGKLDLVEEKEGEGPYPVEYKKGKKPKNRDPWPNDQIQLCAQAILMGENGLPLPSKGYLYYISSRARVEVPIGENLIEETRETISKCRQISGKETAPPLAENRNKCFGCSLNAICLPEEEEVAKGKKANARTILPMGLDGDVLYVDTIGSYLGLSGQSIKITAPGGEKIGEASLETLREVVLCGPVQATSQVIHACLKENIPIHYLNFYGRYLGLSTPLHHYHGIMREAQWRAHFDSYRSLELAKAVVWAKLTNMRTLMMRYLRDDRTDVDKENFRRLLDLRKKAEKTKGTAPRDPVNALLSFGYSLLAKDCTGTAIRVGLDPYCGFYHTMKYGRPSLALDVMEVFRQPVVDSLVLSCINNGVFSRKDFYQYQTVCYLNEKGRKKFLAQYQLRKNDLVTHPKFHYRLSYDRTIEIQFRLLGKFLLGDIDSYEGFYIR